MKLRRLKKVALLVGCVMPGVRLVCGNELAKLKYRRKS